MKWYLSLFRFIKQDNLFADVLIVLGNKIIQILKLFWLMVDPLMIVEQYVIRLLYAMKESMLFTRETC